MCVKIFHFKCVYIGQPVSDISEFLTAYIHKCTVKTIVPYNASYYASVNSKHQHPPPPQVDPGGIFFKVVKFSGPGQKRFAKLRPRGKKNRQNPAPGDNFVDLQDNFAMIVKLFAFFWYSSLAWLSSSLHHRTNPRECRGFVLCCRLAFFEFFQRL